MPYMSANADFIVEEIKDCLMVADTAFEFRPHPGMVAEQGAPMGPPAEEGVFVIWKAAGEKVAPVAVRKGLGNGSRSVVVPLHAGSLSDKDEIVTGVTTRAEGSSAGQAKGDGQNNLFGMNRPQRRQRSTGGADAKPGQTNQGNRPGPPPM